MLFTENGETWESFVYIPKKPIGINPDGTWNYEIVAKLIQEAKQGKEQAIMQLFEQYQYMWKKEITDFVEDMLTYEDAQQEAFYVYLICLKAFDNTDIKCFFNYYQTALHNYLTELTGKEKDYQKELLFSLDERDEEGNLKHDLKDKEKEELDLFPRIKNMLEQREYQIIIAHYWWNIPLTSIAKYLKLSYQYVKELNIKAKEELKALL